MEGGKVNPEGRVESVGAEAVPKSGPKGEPDIPRERSASPKGVRLANRKAPISP